MIVRDLNDAAPVRWTHRLAGMAAIAVILLFQLSSLTVEIAGNADTIATTKRAILWGLLLLVPCLAASGLSGRLLTRGRTNELLKRMAIAAGNGLLLLVPAAFLLDGLAAAGRFDGWFVAIQALEFAAGLVNLVLLALNARDGMRLTGRWSAYGHA